MNHDQVQVHAVQDRGCLGAAKFSYEFPNLLSYGLVAGFADCEVVLREFSKIVPFARDLMSIKKHNEFHAEFIIGANRAVVYFNGSSKNLPILIIEAFAFRLGTIGYQRTSYSGGVIPACERCPSGAIRGCSGNEGFSQFPAAYRPLSQAGTAHN